MRYYIIAGEASGDLHGSNLIKGLRLEDPKAEFRFWGGGLMSEAAGGIEPVRDYRETAVMGVSDVIAKAPKILGNLSFCKQDILEWMPDVVILIDYPGFNLKIAEFCHSKGLKVFYYIAPKTWASREGRNKALKKFVDALFIVFPFEIPYFKKQGIPYIYKGNPLIDATGSHEFKKVCEGNYIAVLPGSRMSEISRMMPVCMEVADRLGCRVVIAGAPSRSKGDYLPLIGGRKNVKLVFDRTYDVLKGADAAIINSGTASLEAALIGTPQVVCWSTTGLNYFVGKYVFRLADHIKYISLANLIADKLVFKEFIQKDFNVQAVCDEVRRLIGDESYRNAMLEDYSQVRQLLGGEGASRAVAKAMIEKLSEPGAENGSADAHDACAEI